MVQKPFSKNTSQALRCFEIQVGLHSGNVRLTVMSFYYGLKGSFNFRCMDTAKLPMWW